MDNNKKKGFLAFQAGTNDKGERYAQHVEGFVVSSNYREASGDKKQMLRMSVSIGRNPWMLLGDDEVKAEAGNQFVNENKPFVSVFVFGKKADELRDVPSKSKILFCGKATKSSYEKDGIQRTAVSVLADNLFVLPTKSTPNNLLAKPDSQVCPTVNIYTGRDSQQVTERLVCLLTGTVKSVAPKNDVNGRSVVNFDLEIPTQAEKVHALCQGTYQKDTEYGKYQVIRCSIWGPRADHMDKILVKGNVLAVTGPTRSNEYKDSTYINMTARALTVLNWANPIDMAAAPANAPVSTNASAPAFPAEPANGFGTDEDYADLMDDFEDGDLPF